MRGSSHIDPRWRWDLEMGPWGTRWFQAVFESMVWDLMEMISFMPRCCCIGNLNFYLVAFLTL
jgi:hypothetical protein